MGQELCLGIFQPSTFLLVNMLGTKEQRSKGQCNYRLLSARKLIQRRGAFLISVQGGPCSLQSGVHMGKDQPSTGCYNNPFHCREEALVRNGEEFTFTNAFFFEIHSSNQWARGEFTCGSQSDNLWACVFSLHRVSSGDQTQAVRVSHTLYPLSHPTSPYSLSPIILCSVLFGL